MIVHFSDKELKLLRYFDVPECFLEDGHMIWAYNAAMKTCFMLNDQTIYAFSLRNCIGALDSGKIYRITNAFDNLITV